MSDDYKKEFRLSLWQSSDEDSYTWPDKIHEWIIHKASDIPDLGDVKELMAESASGYGGLSDE